MMEPCALASPQAPCFKGQLYGDGEVPAQMVPDMMRWLMLGWADADAGQTGHNHV